MQNLNTIPSAGKVSPIAQSSRDSRFSADAQAEGYHLFARKNFEKLCPWIEQDIHEAQSTRSSNAYLTVLAVKPLALGDKPYSEAAHFGDWYVDFDSKPEVEPALRMGLMALDVLNQWGIPDDQIRIWLTGGKGLHIQIHPAVFGWESFDHNEYRVPAYKAFASALDAELVKLESASSGIAPEKVSTHLDTSVYTGKSGRQWREPGVDRGNGQYKVPVTTQEFRDLLTSGNVGAEYVALCSSPRDEPERPAALRSAGAVGKFRQIWEDRKEAIKAEEEVQKERREKMRKFLAEAGEGDEFPAVIGMKICQNIVAAALHKDPKTGKRVTKEGWEGWSEVMRALHYEGHLYDCVGEALQCAIDYSRAVEGFISTADVERRFFGFDDYDKRIAEGKPMTTAKTIFALVRGVQGYRDPNPCGKDNSFRYHENAVDVLRGVLKLKGVELAKTVNSDRYAAAMHACSFAGYKDDVVAEVKTYLKEQKMFTDSERNLKAYTEELEPEQVDEKATDKLQKWILTQGKGAQDQRGNPVLILKDGSIVHIGTDTAARKLAGMYLEQFPSKSWPERLLREVNASIAAHCDNEAKKGAIIEVHERYAVKFSAAFEGYSIIDAHSDYIFVEDGKVRFVDKLPDDLGIQFTRQDNDLPMPNPAILRSGGLLSVQQIREGIQELCNGTRVKDDALYKLASILTYSMTNETAAPMVLWSGPSGSGKTISAEYASQFIAPSKEKSVGMVKNKDALLGLVSQSWFTCLDNVEIIPSEVSHSLCRLVTGDPDSVEQNRLLFTNSGVFKVPCGKVLWFTGIRDPFEKVDASNRVINFNNSEMIQGPKLTQKELKEQGTQSQGGVYAALLSLAARAISYRKKLDRHHPIRLKMPKGRMVEYDLWHVACCQVFGIDEDAALAMVNQERESRFVEKVHNHSVWQYLYRLEPTFVGGAGALEKALRKSANFQFDLPPKDWPKSAKALADMLKDYSTALAAAGFEVKYLEAKGAGKAGKWSIKRGDEAEGPDLS